MSQPKNDLIRPEHEHAINGVPGHMFALRVPPRPWKVGVFANQTWISESRAIEGYGPGAVMWVEMRFDDQCKNGHNTFSVTGEVRADGRLMAGGTLHSDIAQVFPELAPLTRWHLCSTDGPLHYEADTVFLAGNRDHYGRAEGEASSWETFVSFGDVPALHAIKPKFLEYIQARMVFNRTTLRTNPQHRPFGVRMIKHENRPGDTYDFEPKWTIDDYGTKWHEGPFDSQAEAQAFAHTLNTCEMRVHKVPTSVSKGKARELDAARSVACWPEATDEELSVPPEQLREALAARLPGLIQAMRNNIEAAGFLWAAPVSEE